MHGGRITYHIIILRRLSAIDKDTPMKRVLIVGDRHGQWWVKIGRLKGDGRSIQRERQRRTSLLSRIEKLSVSAYPTKTLL
jgi:hypothetical protein